MVIIKVELTGETLNAQEVDFTVRLYFSGDFFLRMESAFALDLDGKTVRLSPEDDEPELFQPMSGLVGQIVAESAIDDAGNLTLVFGNGVTLIAQPDSSYEAWTLTGPNGLMVVCMPGGELARWTAG